MQVVYLTKEPSPLARTKVNKNEKFAGKRILPVGARALCHFDLALAAKRSNRRTMPTTAISPSR